MQSLFYFIITSDLNRKISTMIFSCILFGIMFFLMFYSQYIDIIKNMEIGPKSCVPRIRTGIYFSVFVFGLRHLELF